MGKNLLVLGMSTLAINKEKIVVPHRCTWDGCEEENGIEYYSQLEPISRMIQEKEGSLDQIIILATKETRDLKNFQLGEEKNREETKKKKHEKKRKNKDQKDSQDSLIANYKEMSAVQFYLEQIKKNVDVDKTPKENIDEDGVYVINLSQEDTANAISLSVDRIRKFMAENKDAKLWVDTQGGFRNLNLTVNAIISLLKDDGIAPSGIYSINFDRSNVKPGLIEDQTNSYKIFDFVSGINEFTRYGRADQLEDYYHNFGSDKSPKVIETMKKLVEAIQMCDMNAFENELKQLRVDFGEETENETSLLSIFRNQIKNDYGRLLDEENCTGIDIVEWFYNKKFYQQTLTYIESKMSEDWFVNLNPQRGFLEYKEDKNELSAFKKSMKKEHETDENSILSAITYTCFKWKAIAEKDNSKNKTKIIHINKGITNFKVAYNDDVVNDLCNATLKVCVYVKKEKKSYEIAEASIVADRKNQADKIIDLLLLYKLLKQERNNFNHMSENDERADKETLDLTIEKFIELGKCVMNDSVLINLTNHPSQNWGSKQIEEAEKYGKIIDVPFPDVPADATEKDIQSLSKEIVNRVMKYHPKAVLCQGEFTLAYQMIHQLLKQGVVVLAACSDRKVEETEGKKESYFTFTKFRKYSE